MKHTGKTLANCRMMIGMLVVCGAFASQVHKIGANDGMLYGLSGFGFVACVIFHRGVV